MKIIKKVAPPSRRKKRNPSEALMEESAETNTSVSSPRIAPCTMWMIPLALKIFAGEFIFLCFLIYSLIINTIINNCQEYILINLQE